MNFTEGTGGELIMMPMYAGATALGGLLAGIFMNINLNNQKEMN